MKPKLFKPAKTNRSRSFGDLMGSSLNNNPLVIKVKQGTPRSDESLCSTCRNCIRMVGMNTGREKVYCDSLPAIHMPLREPMVECSLYDDMRRPEMYQMEQMAWIVRTDKKTHKIGFSSPEDRKKEGMDG